MHHGGVERNGGVAEALWHPHGRHAVHRGVLDSGPCGFFNDPSHECTCTPPMIRRYVSKISGPLLDRIDIHIDMPAVKYRELLDDSGGETSEQIRQRVVRARQR